MKYLTPDENYFILDIETDSLQPSVIWCVCTKNLLTGEERTFLNAEEFNSWHNDNHRYVGHNIISFDIPVLNRLWDCRISLDSLCDSLVFSYLYNSAIDGGHSLAAWGERLKFPKGDFSDWSKLSDEMISYCQQDVRLTLKLYNALTDKMRRIGYSEESARIEHRIRIILDQQERNGFYFDKVRGTHLLKYLRDKQADLSSGIHKLFPPNRVLVKEHSKRINKDGGISAQFKKDITRYEVIESGDEYACYSKEEFNIGSPQQRVKRLVSLGWEPQKWTKKGFPKVDEDALLAYAEETGRPEIGAIAEWLVLQGRSSMVEGWLNNLSADSRIHGRILTCGASTRRMTHFSPNTANIPSGAKAKYGHECRELWGVEPDKGLVLVGVDAAGLETVGLLHYLPDKFRDKAAEIFNQKKPNDVHSMNARKLSKLLKRDIDREWGSKTSFYATIYGAYPPTLATIVKGPVTDGEIVQTVLFNSVPGLREVIEESQSEFRSRSGRLLCIDGGFVLCPSLSASLNYRIQSLGAVVMKLAAILLHDEAKKQEIPFKLVGFIHDELQLQTREEFGSALGMLAVDCITRAGRDLGFKVELSGSYLIGTSWNQTH